MAGHDKVAVVNAPLVVAADPFDDVIFDQNGGVVQRWRGAAVAAGHWHKCVDVGE